MSAVRTLLNLLHRKPLKWKRWHPLPPKERAEVRCARRRIDPKPPGGFRAVLAIRRRQLRRYLEMSVDYRVALRTLTLDEMLTLRKTAIEKRYPGRAWMPGSVNTINESASFWLRGHAGPIDGVIICDLIISQIEFRAGLTEGVLIPNGTSVKRYVLHVHPDDWRKLRRASRKDERRAYLALEANVPLNLDEVNYKQEET